MKVILWDVDGTLIRSGYAGVRAMSAAAAAVFAVPRAFDDFDFAGRTDPWAIETICARHGLTPDAPALARFYGVYLERLRIELHNPHARVCPGVRDLLAAIAGRTDLVQGLLTGNVAAGARVKLEHFDLWRHFPFGAFGDDSGDRNALGPVALQRARTHLGRAHLRAEDLVIVGDTPHDVACARAVGGRCILVATGRHAVAELSPHAPDLLLADFADPQPVIDFLGQYG